MPPRVPERERREPRHEEPVQLRERAVPQGAVQGRQDEAVVLPAGLARQDGQVQRDAPLVLRDEVQALNAYSLL